MSMLISGRVLHGDRYGTRLGFPTANLDRRQFRRSRQKPRLGIYAGYAQINKISRKYKAGIVVGPIDKKNLPKLEAHLIGFKGNLYGRSLTLELVRYVRPFRQYKDEAALKRAIKQDLTIIKKILA